MSVPTPPLVYRPALNGVRAIAVWLVILGHWTRLPFPVSSMGRITFFVLSGYLISGIIWKQRIHPNAAGPWWRRLGTFYQRRMIRILPPYYATLVLGALLPLATLHQHPGWFILPLPNLLFYHLQHWGEGVGHYWTMAVDEQFYLVWPFLLGLTGRRAGWFLAVAAASLLFRLGWSAWVTPNFVFVLLPSCLDMFATGALLRIVEHHPRVRQWARGRWVVLAWLAWGGLWAATHLADAPTLWILVYTTVGSGAAFITLSWVLHLPNAKQPKGTHFLSSSLLQWVGQRSYGCYLYHLMLPVIYQRVVYRVFAATETRQLWLSPLPTVLLLLPVLLLVAAASWHWFEAPLDRLKNRLAYS
ncbi:acyltransferase [Hymenobacter sp. BT664]|uniref:Acyltransferase n=1 Tax=Hymenobacter montanus TaxID=2771359 RepID=A0A927GJ30_9BACT|nr:acyltransferase [Hymenobacter montanus]MBD2767696.1 acyltransferase [Hymenobacter montanus]